MLGLVPLGTTGEAPLLDENERHVVIEVCARACAEHRAQLIVGAGSNSTAQTVDAVRALDGTPGLTAVLCLVPYYLRPSLAGIAAHFERVADASPVPVVIYNIPFRTGRRADADTLLGLAQHENVVGVKQSIGSIDQDSLRLLAEAPERFAVCLGCCNPNRRFPRGSQPEPAHRWSRAQGSPAPHSETKRRTHPCHPG